MTITRIWHLLREIDLDALQRVAEARFSIAVAGDTIERAATIARLLSGDGGAVHPWILILDPYTAPSDPPSPDLVVQVTGPRAEAVGPPLSDIHLRTGSGVPVVRVIVSAEPSSHDALPRDGEHTAVCVPALEPASFAPIASAILNAVAPERRLALARRLPGLRAVLFAEIIEEAARANAGYALTTGLAEIIPILGVPLTVGDIVILTKNQVVMGYKLALAAGRPGRPHELIGEILAVLGGGLLFRQIVRELVGLVPIIGIVPKVAVAYAGTWAIGQAVTVWAEEGSRAPAGRLKNFYREGLVRGRAVARQLVSRVRPASPSSTLRRAVGDKAD